MRITQIRELTVPLVGQVANAVVDFSGHTVSLVALVTGRGPERPPADRRGIQLHRPPSAGRHLRERMIPRVLAAPAASLLDGTGERFDPAQVLAAALRNEKPGGHGDRAGAAAALELAVWDLNAKLADESPPRRHARGLRRVPDGSGPELRPDRICQDAADPGVAWLRPRSRDPARCAPATRPASASSRRRSWPP